jgi:YfiH family protein
MTQPAAAQATLPVLRFELPGGGRALFTTRAHGSLSTLRVAGHEQGRAARKRLCEGLELRGLCASRQVHGTAVQRVRTWEGEGGRAPIGGTGTQSDGLGPGGLGRPAVEADGHATALSEVGVMVLTADCLPVVLGTEGAVAALHAGWRGLAAGVLEEGVRALRDVGGDGEIVAIVGPGAGACCYEVGDEVHAAFGGAHRHGRNLDLPALAHERLTAAGVARVQDVALCTICDERCFSHRREGMRAGRQAGVAWLS